MFALCPLHFPNTVKQIPVSYDCFEQAQISSFIMSAIHAWQLFMDFRQAISLDNTYRNKVWCWHTLLLHNSYNLLLLQEMTIKLKLSLLAIVLLKLSLHPQKIYSLRINQIINNACDNLKLCMHNALKSWSYKESVQYT